MRGAVLAASWIAMTAACATDPDLGSDELDGAAEEATAESGAELGDYPSEPPTAADKIYHGDPVNGAGDRGQWEGIVMIELPGSGGYCSGFFITDRHVVTSGHCFDNQGHHTVRLRAPTWDAGAPHQYTAWVNRAGSARAIDVAVVQFASPVAWATPARRFRLFTGTTRNNTMLDIYGYGAQSQHDETTPVLRRGDGGSRVRLTDHGDGWFKAEAREARICHGDSGGPAIREGEKAIVWGIAHGGQNDAGNECPSYRYDMTWTKVNHNMAYIERALGFECERFTADDQNYARCW
jgi:hypothetical protein